MNKKNIIFIVSVKLEDDLGRYSKNRSKPYDYSINSWKDWASKNNSEVVVLDELAFPIQEMSVCWQRYYLFDILEQNEIEYDQVLMADADTIVHPNCPNFFDMTERKYCGVQCEGSYDWLFRSLEIYSKFGFDGITIPFYKYINGGFQIVNSDHKKFFKDMIQLYNDFGDEFRGIQREYHLGTDQTPLNFMLNIQGVDLKILPYEFNMQDMNRKEILNEQLTFTKIGWVYHFNAIPDQLDGYDKTEYWMKRTYEALYE
jgi:lipopolysaccharide biosynthesis glycosyltransferase